MKAMKSVVAFVHLIIVLFALGSGALVAFRVAAAGNPRDAKRICICARAEEEHSKSYVYLCLFENELGFLSANRMEAPRDAPVLGHKSVSFMRDGAYIRTHVVEYGQDVPKLLAERNGWYLTADYSTESPTVVLTKEPTKHSEWDFVDVKDPDLTDDEAFAAQIKNRNVSAKAVWLDMQRKGIVYQGGKVVCRPALSSDQKRSFVIRDADAGK